MDYNLGDTRTCLVGNWSEEKRLHEYAGHYRAAPTKDSTHTYKRCIEHTNKIATKEMNTTNRLDFNDPKHPENPLVYKPDAVVGARQKAIMAKLQTVAAEKKEREAAPREWDTIASTSYSHPEVDEYYAQTLGARRMRTLDNAPIKGRDRTWLLEHNVAAAHICLENRETLEEEMATSALLQQDIAITVYSAKPEIHTMSNPSEGVNPFGKHSQFSMPIGHYIGPKTMKDL